MSFEREPKRIASSIADVSIHLFDPDPNVKKELKELQTIRYGVQIKYDNGEIKGKSGDLIPHLTSAQKKYFITFMSKLRTKVESEIINK